MASLQHQNKVVELPDCPYDHAFILSEYLGFLELTEGELGHSVICLTCGATGPIMESPEQAIDAYKRRIDAFVEE
jgi:hypothetical protein